MLLQERYIPIKIYLTHISHFPELPFLRICSKGGNFLFTKRKHGRKGREKESNTMKGARS